MAETWEREQVCEDVSGRDRRSLVFLTAANRIAVRMPPGEVGTFTPTQAKNLQSDLMSAILEATRRGAEWG